MKKTIIFSVLGFVTYAHSALAGTTLYSCYSKVYFESRGKDSGEEMITLLTHWNTFLYHKVKDQNLLIYSLTHGQGNAILESSSDDKARAQGIVGPNFINSDLDLAKKNGRVAKTIRIVKVEPLGCKADELY